MNKFFTIIATLGLMSSFAFAADAPAPEVGPAPAPAHQDDSSLDYRCRFESCQENNQMNRDRLECWVEGSVCRDRDNDGLTASNRRCEDQPIRIKCSNGFRLTSDDAAVQLEEGNLWFNAESGNKIATLLVNHFSKDLQTTDRGHHLKAELLFSGWVNKAHRLSGSCEFQRSRR